MEGMKDGAERDESLRRVVRVIRGMRAPWAEFHLTKAERWGKTPEQLMRLRRERWEAARSELDSR